MHHLKLLIINNVQLLHEPKHLPIGLRFLEWSGYPSKSLPLNFQSNELVELYMCGSYIEQLWKGEKGLSLDDRYGSQYFDRTYDIIIPGSVIPMWFIHQSIGVEVNIKVEPSSHLCDEWMEIAVCVVFCSLPCHQVSDYCSLACQFVVNGNVMFVTPDIGRIFALSNHIWLLYLLPQSFMDDEDIDLLKECEANEFTQIGIKIKSYGSIMEVKKCGFRMVYKKDIEDLNQTMARSCNTNIIPYEGLDGKCTHGDYDGAGPSGERSFNELPHSQRDERFTEFMAHGDSDYEEYLECSEELGD